MNSAQKEEQRNLLWKILIAVSSILLIAIAAYFIVQLFIANPLEGEWSYEDSNLLMVIQDEDMVEIRLPDYFVTGSVTVSMPYEVDVNTKTFTLRMDEEALAEASKRAGGEVSVSEIRDVVAALEGVYDYNIEQNQLTLTEREYGEQLTFDKQ